MAAVPDQRRIVLEGEQLTILNGLRFVLAMFIGTILLSGVLKSLRAFQNPPFHAKGRNRQMMLFFFTPLSVKMQCRTARRLSGIALIKIKFRCLCNNDDRRQWRKQEGVVGAAASKT